MMLLRLNAPTMIGLDANENIYFYDSGNRHTRMIKNKTGIVQTLYQGSCFEYINKKYVIHKWNYSQYYTVCYRKWLLNGEIYVNNANLCTKHKYFCEMEELAQRLNTTNATSS